MAVSFTESVKPHLALLPNDYNDAADFLLGGMETWPRAQLAQSDRKMF